MSRPSKSQWDFAEPLPTKRARYNPLSKPAPGQRRQISYALKKWWKPVPGSGPWPPHEPAPAPSPTWNLPPRLGPWRRTRERLKIIRRNLDKTDEEIGRLFGVTRAAVFALRVRYGIAKKSVSTQRRDRFIELIRKMQPDLTAAKLSLKLGLAEGKARYYAGLAGYRFLPRTEETDRYWQERFKSLPPALTVGMAARQLGISYRRAYRLCKKHRCKVRDGRSSRLPPHVPGRR